VTLSWEPGLRGIEAWRAWLDAMEAHASRAVCDMRIHLRFEAHALDVADEAEADIAAGRVHLLSFNDHLPEILRKLADPVTGAKFAARGPLALPAFRALAERVAAGASGIPATRDRLAAAARTAGLPMASHDDATLAARDGFRALGARICDFPMNEAVARAATEAGDAVLMGCPNVVRGGSHLGWASAATMAETGLCSVLASDYFYPAMLPAAFVLAARGRLSLPAAWAMLSTNPARAAGLVDRGRIAQGLRADLVVVDARGTLPHVVATVAAGRLAWLGAQGAALLGG
jgi:alpha-D-ribose 1-methylphosphonate 5-triphosphate diphosphatase